MRLPPRGRLGGALVLAGWLADPYQLRELFLGFGVLSPVSFVLVQAAQVVVTPLPGQSLRVGVGYRGGGPGSPEYSVRRYRGWKR